MNILPKKVDIDREKNLERKKEIDSGVELANRIDRLRQTKLTEEAQLLTWRENTLKIIKNEIDDYIRVRENLREQTEEATRIKDALLKPDILQVKVELANMVKDELIKRNIYLSGETLKEEEKNLRDGKAKLAHDLTEIEIKQSKILKLESETIKLKNLAIKEVEKSRKDRTNQIEEYDNKISEVQIAKETYENGVRVYEIHKKELEEKESDLLLREKHLASQQEALKIAMEEIKKYGSLPTNN